MNFKDITQFDLKRTGAEAIWFYAVYTVFALLVTLAIGLIILPYLTADSMQDEVLRAKIGRSVAIILSSGLALLIVLAKDYHRNIVYLVLILLAAALASWAGVFLGLVIPALLTMLSKSGEVGSLLGTQPFAPAFFDAGLDTLEKNDLRVKKDVSYEKVETVKTEEKGDGYTVIRNEPKTEVQRESERKTSPIKYSDHSKENESVPKETRDAQKQETVARVLPSTQMVKPPMVKDKLKKIEG